MKDLKHVLVVGLVSLAFLSSIRDTVAAVDEVPVKMEKEKEIDRFIRWSGDLRIRHDVQSSDDVINGSAHQQRLAFRFGGKAMMNESTDIEFRLGTGTGRTSLNQTQGQTSTSNSGFSNIDFRLDRAFFDWHHWKGTHFYGGRVKNTLSLPGGNDLQFDTDLNFDGWAGHYKIGEENLQPFVSAHYYWVNKSTTSTVKDTHLTIAQTGVKSKGESIDWAVTVGVFRYDYLQGSPVIGAAKGNSAVGGNYTNHYRMGQVGFEVGIKIAEKPVVVYADLIRNAAATSEDTAYVAGVKYGSQKKKGDIQVTYDYRKVERDSLVGAFTEGEIVNGAGSNVENHRIRVCYVPSEGVCLGAFASLGKKNIANGQTSSKNDRYMADIQYSF